MDMAKWHVIKKMDARALKSSPAPSSYNQVCMMIAEILFQGQTILPVSSLQVKTRRKRLSGFPFKPQHKYCIYFHITKIRTVFKTWGQMSRLGNSGKVCSCSKRLRSLTICYSSDMWSKRHLNTLYVWSIVTLKDGNTPQIGYTSSPTWYIVKLYDSTWNYFSEKMTIWYYILHCTHTFKLAIRFIYSVGSPVHIGFQLLRSCGEC